jgi:hypothetical protein
MRSAVRVVVGVCAVAALALAAFGAGVFPTDTREPIRHQARSATPASTEIAAPDDRLMSSSDGLVSSTRDVRGLFRRLHGGHVRVAEADLDPTWNAATTIKEKPRAAKSCVEVRSERATGFTCARKPLFRETNLLFLESFVGGPSRTDRTEYVVAGIASARVHEITVVMSDGSVAPAQLSTRGAFLFELSRSQLVVGTTATHLRAYSADGSLVEQVSL